MDKYLLRNIEVVTNLSVLNQNISDLTGIEDFTNFSLYPNPASNSFSINSNNSDLESVVVYVNLGREVVRFNTQESYNISNLNVGVYYVSIESENSNQTKKLVIVNYFFMLITSPDNVVLSGFFYAFNMNLSSP